MKRIITCLGILCVFSGTIFATKHTIVTGEMSFIPETLFVDVGDTVEFIIYSPHSAIQVDENAWLNNEVIPTIEGFYFESGSYEHVIKSADPHVIYYICLAHASMGMKGRIFINNFTGINTPANSSVLNVYPSLLKENETISIELPGANSFKARVYGITGVEVAKVDVNDSQLALPATFGKGIYFLRVIDSNKKMYVKKIVIN